jgi:hypothetical protein
MGKRLKMENNFAEVTRDGKTFIRVPPDASRMVRGMGKLSYEFEQAIADLIDNSIAANATKVEVVIEQRIGGKVYIHVADDGDGIETLGLPKAIQYGAADRNNDSSLGVYGFGLKTACQSFASSFKVVSKVKEQADYSMIIFDEDIIQKYDDFYFEVGSPSKSLARALDNLATGGSGTLVVTENADRVNTLQTASDEKRMKDFLEKGSKSKVEKTKLHLRKTFQRYLDKDDTRAANIEISVNGVQLAPWDPFCKKEGNFLEKERIFPPLMTKSGKSGTVVMRGYILPSKVEFADKDLRDDADIGPSTHGVYVYRENRLLEQATYFGLFKRETHNVSLRVEFSYEGSLDELFQTALQKGSMVLGDLEEAVRDFLSPLIRETSLRSRGHDRKRNTKGIHELSQKRITAAEGRVGHAQIEAVDEKSAKVISKYGEAIYPIRSFNDSSEALPINPVDEILDGHLWQMRLQNNRQVVEINKGHDFYQKVYLANMNNSIAIQGLDMLLWSLAITEQNCTIPEYMKQFREFRFEVSRTLRELVESLPEPKLEELDE